MPVLSRHTAYNQLVPVSDRTAPSRSLAPALDRRSDRRRSSGQHLTPESTGTPVRSRTFPASAGHQTSRCRGHAAPGGGHRVIRLSRTVPAWPVSPGQCLLFGANTPYERTRLTRGLGTRAASRAMKSSERTRRRCVYGCRDATQRRLASRRERRLQVPTQKRRECRPPKKSFC